MFATPYRSVTFAHVPVCHRLLEIKSPTNINVFLIDLIVSNIHLKMKRFHSVDFKKTITDHKSSQTRGLASILKHTIRSYLLRHLGRHQSAL